MKYVWLLLAVACGTNTSSPAADAPSGNDDLNLDASVDATDDSATSCTDGMTRSCGTDVGACEAGVETCNAGVWGECTGGIASTTELCDGVLDENCDGNVDDGCASDPFIAESCGGPPADAATVLAGGARVVLASATIQVRTRTCTGPDCGPWSAGSNWQTRFLTYSGGVTTRYQNVQADTRLVAYTENGAPKLSLQHVTFPQGNYPDRDGIVFAFPPEPQTYPVLRAFNVAPAFPSDYEDLELTLKNGQLSLGTRCAIFTATVFGSNEPYTTTYAALYRW